MKVVKKSQISNIYIDLPSNDYELYNPSKTYNVGDKVSLDGFNYHCTADGVVNKNPKANPQVWVSQPTNARAWQYAKTSLKTEFSSELIITFRAKYANNISFFNLNAKKIELRVLNPVKGNFEAEENLRLDSIKNFADYLFAPFAFKSQCFFSFPLVYEGEVQIRITPNINSRLGYIHVGKTEDLGLSLYGGGLGLKSFTKKERNVWGDMQIKEGNSYQVVEMPVLIEEDSIDRVYNLLKDAEKDANVYIADESKGISNLNILGVFKDLLLPIRKGKTEYTLRLESVI